ncbi:hypothetical protein Desgi_2991 [Desulfoscipio gibsoniae DSM 7213]|uniref:Uncharacterized protein n=1 Tax=Desulfoscipio gibsoniae DSM 7213 TaxID=767817 RepID=R4KRZ6_9FIRM|nr:hypothetical protein Desgi_2991 [Desulfoscipio gibsoniae DSM 7213]
MLKSLGNLSKSKNPAGGVKQESTNHQITIFFLASIKAAEELETAVISMWL